jgi:hypothetical protein
MSVFEFKVVTDKDGKPVELDKMSIDAAKAFLAFYQTLVSLADISESSENADKSSSYITIKSGSAVASVSGDTAERIYEDFESVVTGQCDNPIKVKLWRDTQSLLQANGLGYEINHIKKGSVKNLYNRIVTAKRILKKPIKTQYANSIKFFSGRLINVGGKIPNIHIELNNDEKITVDCHEEIALSAKDYLYTSIRVAVWAKESSAVTSNSYELCDVYNSDKDYEFFKNYFESLGKLDKISALTNIHQDIKELLAEGNFKSLRKLLKLWLHPSTDVQTMKIILVITKQFSKDPEISQYIDKFQEYFKIQNLKLLKQYKKGSKQSRKA